VTGRASILVVDDDPMVLAGVGRHLRPFRPVIGASSGQAALDVVDSGVPLCGALIDVNLGDGPDGIAVLHHLRARFPTIPVVVLTGELSERAAVASFDFRARLLHKNSAELRLSTFGVACLVADLHPEEAIASNSASARPDTFSENAREPHDTARGRRAATGRTRGTTRDTVPATQESATGRGSSGARARA